MLKALHTRLTANAPAPIRILVNILFLPYFIFRFFKIVNSFIEEESGVHLLDEDTLCAQLRIDFVEDDPISVKLEKLSANAIALVDAKDWDGLEAFLAQPELQQPHTIGVTYMNNIASDVWEHVSEPYLILSREHPAAEHAVPDNILAPLIAATNDGQNPQICFLVVDLLVFLGWGKWGGAFAKSTDYDPEIAQGDICKLAQSLLLELPESTHDTAQFRRAEFLTRAGVASTAETMTAYAKWQSVAPESLEAYRMLALALLPQTTGDAELYVDMSEDVFERSKAKTKAAGYAVYALTAAMSDEDDRYRGFDIARLVDGIGDLIDMSQDRDVAVNLLCGMLYFLSMEEGDIWGDEPDHQRHVHHELRELFEKLVRTELRVAYPTWWDNDARTLIYALAEVYEAEITAGETIQFGH
ncbi:hypothetical protein SAMN04488030_2343 [Aliiroseovarius halocynthiae]|uniref:Uncharacterized protein n=1 Tax=Aliiroseovarius halocynthiae TaxID=985055 RepID=A0A545SZK9_9RHOB|nr:hypothetical protein [Aliiroseovarius halocynthiae]TQV70369.1 hypothetical protein FIL88_00230 [Aliiroseovarius halocynthiae]SMR81930.1 hypothetical protein SAMN04488030_2343 [Aliiroseovarius halocynthiae]